MRRRVIEPMMTHRKPKTRHQKPVVSKTGDEFTSCSEGCVSGVHGVFCPCITQINVDWFF